MTLKNTLTLAAGLAGLALILLVAGYDVGFTLRVLSTLGSITVVGMIVDSRTEFADATALSTAGTGLALVGNAVDLSVASGIGANIDKPLYLVVQVDTDVTSGGAATVQFVLASDAQAAIAVDGTATEHFRTFAVPKATLVKGFAINIPVPPPTPNYERYLGLLQNVGVAALTAGKINAFLTTSPTVWQARADAL